LLLIATGFAFWGMVPVHCIQSSVWFLVGCRVSDLYNGCHH